jgi:hypothetical protein
MEVRLEPGLEGWSRFYVLEDKHDNKVVRLGTEFKQQHY